MNLQLHQTAPAEPRPRVRVRRRLTPSPEADPEISPGFAPHPARDPEEGEWEGAEGAPRFDERLRQNLTAIRGRDIELTCKVYNLGNKTVRLSTVHSLNGGEGIETTGRLFSSTTIFC